eukprot:CAMPEP_0117420702 /NCGR_PEP_ID=MMETSP0758-20121206/1979_1 /TAXON_ID=63605 /ORGANISM="Percolomonas cosmopolitus, Strain AE-1 (ATCC 50343)" /LENGTH=244 /DNA_ID=CAMNT_0005202461 /DNA_START=865 /DNA_END=1595 /DNA_ORIENTATION=-
MIYEREHHLAMEHGLKNYSTGEHLHQQAERIIEKNKLIAAKSSLLVQHSNHGTPINDRWIKNERKQVVKNHSMIASKANKHIYLQVLRESQWEKDIRDAKMSAQYEPGNKYASLPALMPKPSRDVTHSFKDDNRLVTNPEVEYERHGSKAIRNSFWTADEIKLFIKRYMQYPKDFHQIAKGLKNKSTQDCVCFYYDNKKGDPRTGEFNDFRDIVDNNKIKYIAIELATANLTKIYKLKRSHARR